MCSRTELDDVSEPAMRFSRWGGKRVLLREPEKCLACEGEFLSLYPLKDCIEHAGLDKF